VKVACQEHDHSDDSKVCRVVSFYGTTSEMRQIAQFLNQFADRIDSYSNFSNDALPHEHLIDWSKSSIEELGFDLICYAKLK
jgi:hypothetical protein